MESNKLENKELCTKCGGFCCKKSGCDYSANDFESLHIDDLELKLKEGHISIVSVLKFKQLKNFKISTQPFLYLRARNVDRPIVDLVSLKTPCSMLTENGCTYSLENRPSGGVNLIPAPELQCYPLKDPEEIVNSWKSYQNVLMSLVKRFTGKNLNESLKKDIKLFFLSMIKKDFEHVSTVEQKQADEFMRILKQAYPELWKEACKESKNQYTLQKRMKK
ncbi:MAG: hypothetical protein KH135_00060 [Firmicutes bacterium]|nr:hypothetical protein [Bacillota bacterium]